MQMVLRQRLELVAGEASAGESDAFVEGVEDELVGTDDLARPGVEAGSGVGTLEAVANPRVERRHFFSRNSMSTKSSRLGVIFLTRFDALLAEGDELVGGDCPLQLHFWVEVLDHEGAILPLDHGALVK